MKRLTAICMILATMSLVGCGGSGGGSTTTGGRKVAVLATDSFREDYDQVWATIYKVELLPEGGGAPVVAFDDPTGRQIDLKTLRDATGARYAFLGEATLPAGNYTGVRFTLARDMRLVEHGKTTTSTLPLSSTLPVDGLSHPQLTVSFPSARPLSSTGDDVVVDFDLANFVIQGGRISPSVLEGDRSGLSNPSRHEHEDYKGTVRDLSGTAPTQSFTLNRGRGMTLTVVTTAATAIYGSGGALADGKPVEVTGRYNATTDRLVATKIEVDDSLGSGSESEGSHTPEIKGGATSIQATAGTFVVSLRRAKGFAPGQVSVNVITAPNTVFRTDGGRTKTKAEFFALLTTTPYVEVEGTYDAATNTLTAFKAKIEDESDNGGWENESHHDQDDDNHDGKIDDDGGNDD